MRASKLTAVLLYAAAVGCVAMTDVALAFPMGGGDAPTTRPAAPPPAAPPPAAPPPDPAPAARSATADNIVVTRGKATIRIGHIEVAGSSLTAADLVALFDTKDPKALEARLRKLDATSVLIPAITMDSVDGTRESHATQTQVLLADVHAGRATTGSAAAGTLVIKTDKDETRISTGATTFKGLDLAQIVHLATGPRTDEGEAPRPLADEIAIQTVSIGGAVADGPPVTIATIRATALAGRPLADDLPVKGKTGTENVAALDDLAHSFSADLVEADDLGLGAGERATSKGLKSFALRHIALHGLGGGKLARFEMSGLAMEGNEKQPGRLAIGSAEIDAVASNKTPVPSIDRIDLRDLAIDVPDEGGKAGGRIALSVAHAGYAAQGLVIGKLPPKATLSIEHATFDVPADSGAAPVLLAMGYKHLDLSSETVSRYDGTAQTLDLDRMSLAGVGMGALDIKVGLAKVSDGIVSQIDAVQKAAAAAIIVKSMDLTLRNDGLIDKAIAFKAAIDGITVEQERTNIVQLVDTALVGFDLQGSAKAQKIVGALHKFIAEPKRLHIALSSKTGLGAESLPLINSPQALLDALDVEAGADE